MSTPIEVTHYLCPDGIEATHHLIPKRAGTIAGEPASEQTCTYCRRSEKQLREDIEAHGGVLHPQLR